MNRVDELMAVRAEIDRLRTRERVLVGLLSLPDAERVSSDGKWKTSAYTMRIWNWDTDGLVTRYGEEVETYRRVVRAQPVVKLLTNRS